MPAFFLELFSEEIPARMQARAADDLARLVNEALAALKPSQLRTFHGPRRLALAADVAAEVAASATSERGPRRNAPEQALAGFLRKHGAGRDQLRQEGDYWVLEKTAEAVPAATLIAVSLPALLRRFPWPKSMRWGGTSSFTWIRPLRRITCLVDGAVVPFHLREGNDDGHGLFSANLTEGHRFHAPGEFAVTGVDDWRAGLRDRCVLVDADDRKRAVAEGIAGLAADELLTVVDDPGLLDEVAGLVEFPVPLLGRIADEHMDLPPEVMQVSMRVNQRYFALRAADGRAAPWFGFVANIRAEDDGATIVAGNERVLRARFADARHFWDLDRKARLESRVPLLDHVTFHASLGTQGERVRRLRRLASAIAPQAGAGAALADRAAELAKADLVTGMVGEFPELQGVMGRYYALHDGEDRFVADAIRDHYAPRGQGDAVATEPVSVAVSLADKLDQLVAFFAINEKPTGSGDPYALRRSALGIIRTVRDNNLRIALLPHVRAALHAVRETLQDVRSRRRQEAAEAAHAGATAAGGDTSPVDHGPVPLPPETAPDDPIALDVIAFIIERLRIQLRAEGSRHDVLDATVSARWDDDIVRVLARTEAVGALVGSETGADLLTAYRRAANILRIEARKDGPHDSPPETNLFRHPEEIELSYALDGMQDVTTLLEQEDYGSAMARLSRLRGPLDMFFDRVTVNATEPALRVNRLRLLNRVRSTMNRIAEFSRIES